MHVLTVYQPWAWAIFYAGKDVENRRHQTPLRGELAIHAGRRIDYEAIESLRAAGYHVPNVDELFTGGIIGTVLLTDCTRDSPSAWAKAGAWHWQLADPLVFARPIAHRGQPGLHTSGHVPPRASS